MVMSHSVVNLTSCNFGGNTASFGGAIISEASNITITNTLFSHNQAKDCICEHCNGSIMLPFTSLQNNQAGSGGAVYLYESEALLEIAVFCTIKQRVMEEFSMQHTVAL